MHGERAFLRATPMAHFFFLKHFFFFLQKGADNHKLTGFLNWARLKWWTVSGGNTSAHVVRRQMAPQPLPTIPFHFLHFVRLPPRQVTKRNERKLHMDRFNAEEAADEQILHHDLRKLWNICQQIPTWLWHLKGFGQVVFRKGFFFLTATTLELKWENIPTNFFFFSLAPRLDLFLEPIRQGMSQTSEYSV